LEFLPSHAYRSWLSACLLGNLFLFYECRVFIKEIQKTNERSIALCAMFSSQIDAITAQLATDAF
jgi:hypothetical protein